MAKIRNISISIPEYIYFNFKHKCSFYDLSRSDVIVTMIEKFIDGDFDNEFGVGRGFNEGSRDTNASN